MPYDRASRTRCRTVFTRMVALGAIGIVVAACSASDIVGDPVAGTGAASSPDAVNTPEGALQFFQGVVSGQAAAVTGVVGLSGYLTDELGSLNNNNGYTDSRHLPENSNDFGDDVYGDVLFKALHAVRAGARQGRGVVAQYLPTASSDMAGYLYAMEAMSDVQLAEIFCSGIPLSTVNYDGSVTVRAGSSSSDVYRVAVALFDSAITLTTDSAEWRNFAKVGKGRALLDLGDFTGAAQAVADVPLEFRYLVQYNAASSVTNGFSRIGPEYSSARYRTLSNEGGNGLPFGTAHDWRTDTTTPPGGTLLTPPDIAPVVGREPHKYGWTGATPIILASGVEARLIGAESDLHAGGTQWLTILNELRTACNPGSTCASDLIPFDAFDPLPPIVDPGTLPARIDTLFGERAAWLYLTGHREGDMRRLIRQYQRARDTVYPTGLYTAAVGSSLLYTTYGGDINIPIPINEHTNNSKFTGCIDRGA